MRPITLCTYQWLDIPFDTLCHKAKSFGFDGLELACASDHFEVDKADIDYCNLKKEKLAKNGLEVFAISCHPIGQAVSDRIDQRHKNLLPERIWGDGKPEEVRKRAAEEVIKIGEAAARLGISTVNGFTGSPIWHLAYSFPPVPSSMIEEGFEEFANSWVPILNEYKKLGVRFALEVHPTEIAFDIASARKTLDALNNHIAFGFNYDPSHMGYQGVDYVKFIQIFKDRIFHVHMKDVMWSEFPAEAGVFGGHTTFGALERYWDFRSLGRGRINFEEIIRNLNRINYNGPLSIEWEDNGMNREYGAKDAYDFVRKLDFPSSNIEFDSIF